MASFVLPLISGLAGLFGGGTQKTVNTTGQQNGSSGGWSNGGSSNTNSFNYNPLQQATANNFLNSANNQVKNAADLTPYTQQGLQGINQQGNANASAISNNLAARGLSFSPAAGTALTQNQLNTGNQEQQFMSQVPLLQNQLQTQAQTNAENALRGSGVSQTQTGTQYGNQGSQYQGNSSGTQTTSGNPMGGLFGGLGAGLAATPNISSILASLFGGGGSNPNGNPNSSSTYSGWG